MLRTLRRMYQQFYTLGESQGDFGYVERLPL